MTNQAMTNAEAIAVLLDWQKRGTAFCRYTAIERDDAMQLALAALGYVDPNECDEQLRDDQDEEARQRAASMRP